MDKPVTGFHSGFTPLKRADRLAKELGCRELYIKDDSCNYPTYSYKERVVSVAISKAVEFGFDTVGCASTGNLANSVAAHAASAGIRCFVMIPHDLEQGKVLGSLDLWSRPLVRIRGNYDDVNRLCTEIADKYGWAIVNVNLRPYYTEGAKTFGFEIAEQLGLGAAAAHGHSHRRWNDSAQGLQGVSGIYQAWDWWKITAPRFIPLSRRVVIRW